MAIGAAVVKELRERTGAGMMDCKRALVEAGGDLEQASELLRKSGQAKADKKAARVAAEGTVLVKGTTDGNKYVVVEINSETDFVAKDENFAGFAATVAEAALTGEYADVAALMASDSDGKTLETRRQELVAKVGENIAVLLAYGPNRCPRRTSRWRFGPGTGPRDAGCGDVAPLRECRGGTGGRIGEGARDPCGAGAPGGEA